MVTKKYVKEEVFENYNLLTDEISAVRGELRNKICNVTAQSSKNFYNINKDMVAVRNELNAIKEDIARLKESMVNMMMKDIIGAMAKPKKKATPKKTTNKSKKVKE